MKPHTATPLFQALHRRYADSSLLVIVLLALALFVVAMFSLHNQMQQRLELVARTIAYSTEAALLFEDTRTATEILNQIGSRENLRAASIETVDGQLFSAFERSPQGICEHLSDQLATLLFPTPTRSDIRFGEQQLGRIIVHGSGGEFISYLMRAVAVALLCGIMFVFIARRLARHMAQRISDQLETLTRTIHELRQHQDFRQRVPSFDIHEFDQLGHDFNALFAELHARDEALSARQHALEQDNQQLSRQAQRDGLTGLANRRGFNLRFGQMLEQARHSDQQLALLYLDSDRFKQVNDQHGHALGDALLIEIAARIRRCVRDSDLIARLGGDEFCIVLDGIRDHTDATRIAHDIVEAMRPSLLEQGILLRPSVSIGIAIYPAHGSSVDDLLIAADAAMYRAKQSRRGSYLLYNQTLSEPGQAP